MENVNVNVEKFIKKVKANEKYGQITLVNNPQEVKWMVQNIHQIFSQMLTEGMPRMNIQLNWIQKAMPAEMSVKDYEAKIAQEAQIVANMAVAKFNKAYEGTGLTFAATGFCNFHVNQTPENKLRGFGVIAEILIDTEFIKEKAAAEKSIAKSSKKKVVEIADPEEEDSEDE